MIDVKTGDVIIVNNNAVFEIIGIYVGDVTSQNLIGLRPMSKKAGFASGSVKRGPVEEMLVPEELVSNVPRYRQVNGSSK